MTNAQTDHDKQILIQMALAGWPSFPEQCEDCGLWYMLPGTNCQHHIALDRFQDPRDPGTGNRLADSFTIACHRLAVRITMRDRGLIR